MAAASTTVRSIAAKQFRDSFIEVGVFKVTGLAFAATTAGAVSAAVDVTVTGVKVGDIVLVAPLGTPNDKAVVSGNVTAADTVSFVLQNGTGSSLTAAAEDYSVVVLRPKTA